MLGSPDETAYDLRFRCPGHSGPGPSAVLAGDGIHQRPDGKTCSAVAIFIACAFISILVHELGHGLTSRAMGERANRDRALRDGGLLLVRASAAESPWQRLFVLLLGPGAGFVLLGLVLAVANIGYGVSPIDAMAMVDVGNGDAMRAADQSTLPAHDPGMADLLLMQINFWWGVLNLLPIWPLDGGQITGVILACSTRAGDARATHIISLLTAGIMAVWCASTQDSS